MEKFDQIINQLSSDFIYRWKVFILSMLAVFLMVTIPHLNLNLPQIISPLPQKRDSLELILPKLSQKLSNFHLSQSRSTTFPSAVFSQVSAYLVMDFETGEVLAEKSSLNKLPIASLTKIMTSVVALDLAKPTEVFTVPGKAVNIEPTRIGVVEGQKMSLKELLTASILTSANDAVEVIKARIDQKYGEGTFVKAMNLKAQILGLDSTHFDNPQGFDGEGNYSSAQDLAKLSQYALSQYPTISDIAKLDYQLLPPDQNHKIFDLYNWNGLLGVYPGIFGLKIGNSGEAGKTTIAVSKRDNKKVLVVLLGAPGVLERDLWASKLLDLGFEHFSLPPVNLTAQDLKSKYSTWKYWN